jgi:hypothetical protein
VLKSNFLLANNSRDAKAVGNINRRRVVSNSRNTTAENSGRLTAERTI